MADINIERKSTSIWPWIIGLLLLAIVVFVVLQTFKGGSEDEVVTPVDSATIQQPQYQPAPPPAPVDSPAGDSTVTDSVAPATTTSM